MSQSEEQITSELRAHVRERLVRDMDDARRFLVLAEQTHTMAVRRVELFDGLDEPTETEEFLVEMGGTEALDDERPSHLLADYMDALQVRHDEIKTFRESSARSHYPNAYARYDASVTTLAQVIGELHALVVRLEGAHN